MAESHQRLICPADLIDDKFETTESDALTLLTPPSPPPESQARKEYVWVVARCSLIACLISLVAGMTVGFSSPALLELTNENLTTPAQQLQEGSTLSSLFGVRYRVVCLILSCHNTMQTTLVFGALVGSPLAWPAIDYFGCQKALKLGGIPALCGWLLISNSVHITENTTAFLIVLFLGRLLTGLSLGWSLFAVSVSFSGLFFEENHHYFISSGLHC